MRDMSPMPSPTPSPSGWIATHRVPAGGMIGRPTWLGRSARSMITLEGGLEVIVVERAGDWVRVTAVNGWTGWVDGRRLVTLP